MPEEEMEYKPVTMRVHEKTGQIELTIPAKYRGIILKEGLNWKVIPQKVWGKYSYEYFVLKPIK